MQRLIYIINDYGKHLRKRLSTHQRRGGEFIASSLCNGSRSFSCIGLAGQKVVKALEDCHSLRQHSSFRRPTTETPQTHCL